MNDDARADGPGSAGRLWRIIKWQRRITTTRAANHAISSGRGLVAGIIHDKFRRRAGPQGVRKIRYENDLGPN